MSSRSAVVVGASAGVGRALAEALARRGFRLALVSSDARDVEAIASDLRARFEVSCFARAADLAAADFSAEALLSAAETDLGGCCDAILIPAGAVDDGDDRPLPQARAARLARVNYESVLALAAAAARRFEERGRGRIVCFSSIAADAPRRRNMVYASAKAGLQAYCRALRHYFAGRDVLVQCWVLGYVDTAMTYGRRLRLSPASPAAAAERVIARLDDDFGTAYFPRHWRWLTALLRALPWPVYRRLDF